MSRIEEAEEAVIRCGVLEMGGVDTTTVGGQKKGRDCDAFATSFINPRPDGDDDAEMPKTSRLFETHIYI
ncbi:unnamed protein product [Macrosiphum euphorbiae]|uniref:Uncharacterized protein n=1 Tax=Macrosiphum euphorbiae TaxID=13131 RepID=A0AAV0X213_9HEMI|nr:unnamed protein product [Macrosiphum euphorbiae]